MSELTEGAIERRRKNRDIRWKENLTYFYRLARKRLLRFIFTFLLAYILIFKTPFIWLLAKPLKIADIPKRSDVILVFAGGVGESGKAGQGHQERVVYAVNLYEKNYAKKIIFSSGYTYVMQEAEVMRALAISLGIPSKDMILEKDASSSYENVKFTREIMKRNNWDSALVVSSPYHMRRVAMTYDKSASDIRICLTPVPYSGFYGNEREVKFRHIRAIFHEYLGIMYYWWKGYI